MRTAFRKAKLNYDIVPPHNHRANTIERVIQTFKNHFESFSILPIIQFKNI